MVPATPEPAPVATRVTIWGVWRQPPLGLLPYRESTPYLRVLTGGLFGFLTAWFGYPVVEETMAATREIMTAKWRRLRP